MRPGFRVGLGAETRWDGADRVGARFTEFAEERGLPAAIRRSMSVALDELLANIIAYGGAARIVVDVALYPDRLSIMLIDDGRPFDPFGQEALPPPLAGTALPLEERRIGGEGIHLVRKMMDDVRYERRADRNVVVLTKRLRAEEG
jgi:anti-sigma regulatory factor (Ser/Thr protein kinase)